MLYTPIPDTTVCMTVRRDALSSQRNRTKSAFSPGLRPRCLPAMRATRAALLVAIVIASRRLKRPIALHCLSRDPCEELTRPVVSRLA